MMEVVMGIIFSNDGKFLIAKRNLDKHFGGLWELPGGKLEEHESPEVALVRELREELSVDVSVLGSLSSYQFERDNLSIRFIPLFAEIVGGVLDNLEHEKIEYVNIDEIDCYEFAPPDYQALDMIRQRLSADRLLIEKIV